MPQNNDNFRVFKQADGSYRWVTISSSAFRDRDGEIITRKALADDVERCDTNKDYGPLRWFHLGGWTAPDGIEKWETWKATAGVDLGSCDFNMLHDRMLIESGTFKDTLTGEAFSQVQDQLEVSIAFSHPPDEPGTKKEYNNIHRFERSLLPAGMASNLLTKFYITKGDPKMKTTEKLAALVAILKGKPDLARQILADAEGVQKAAEAAGLEFKEVSEMLSFTPGEETPEGVIQTPEIEVIAPAAEQVEQKAAPVTPPEVEPVEIGDWSPEQLTAFIVNVMKQSMGKKEEELAAEKAYLHTMQTLTEKVDQLSQGLEAQKESLLDLIDARPVGLKQLQSRRPTEQLSNVVANAPTGPVIDQGFIKFLQGGK